MAYDCCVAICNTLHYLVIMSTRRCCSLVFASYLIGFIVSFLTVLCMRGLCFCDSNVVYHFFCEAPPILPLSCTDTGDIEIMIFFLLSPLWWHLLSQSQCPMCPFCLLSQKLLPLQGSKKPCLLVPPISWQSPSSLALWLSFTQNLVSPTPWERIKWLLFFIVIIPMLNPLIYSLRNKKVKKALSRVKQKRKVSRELK